MPTNNCLNTWSPTALLVTGESPAQKARNAENVSIRWRHRDTPENRQVLSACDKQYRAYAYGNFAYFQHCIDTKTYLKMPTHGWVFYFTLSLKLLIRKSKDYVYGIWVYKVLVNENVI